MLGPAKDSAYCTGGFDGESGVEEAAFDNFLPEIEGAVGFEGDSVAFGAGGGVNIETIWLKPAVAFEADFGNFAPEELIVPGCRRRNDIGVWRLWQLRRSDVSINFFGVKGDVIPVFEHRGNII